MKNRGLVSPVTKFDGKVIMALAILVGASCMAMAQTSSSKIRVGVGIWRENVNDAKAVHAFDTFASFNNEVNMQAVNGYILEDMEIIVMNGTRYYSGIFHQGSAQQKVIANVNQAALENAHTKFTRKGYKIIDVDNHEFNGQRYFSAVWTKTAAFQSELVLGEGLSLFVGTDIMMVGNGLEMSDLESWDTGLGYAEYGGIWRSDVYSRSFHTEEDLNTFLLTADANMAAGLLLVDLDVHYLNGITYYNSVWEAASTEDNAFKIGSCYENVSYFDAGKVGSYIMIDFEIIEEEPNTDCPECDETYPGTGTGGGTPTIPGSSVNYMQGNLVNCQYTEEPECMPKAGMDCVQ